MGRTRYADATELTITADCGGYNGYRTRLWKVELQDLADERPSARETRSAGTSDALVIAHTGRKTRIASGLP